MKNSFVKSKKYFVGIYASKLFVVQPEHIVELKKDSYSKKTKCRSGFQM